MSDLEKQLPVIERLRAERDRLGEKLYALRTDIARTGAALRQSRVSMGRRSAQDREVIAAARAEIARFEARLGELANMERAARARIAALEQAQRQQEFLRRSLAG